MELKIEAKSCQRAPGWCHFILSMILANVVAWCSGLISLNFLFMLKILGAWQTWLTFPYGMTFYIEQFLRSTSSAYSDIIRTGLLAIGWLVYLGLMCWGAKHRSRIIFFIFILLLLLNISGCGVFFHIVEVMGH